MTAPRKLLARLTQACFALITHVVHEEHKALGLLDEDCGKGRVKDDPQVWPASKQLLSRGAARLIQCEGTCRSRVPANGASTSGALSPAAILLHLFGVSFGGRFVGVGIQLGQPAHVPLAAVVDHEVHELLHLAEYPGRLEPAEIDTLGFRAQGSDCRSRFRGSQPAMT